MEDKPQQHAVWFYVSNISLVSETFGTRAYSGANALYAAGGATEAREEIIYTPKFTLESGKPII